MTIRAIPIPRGGAVLVAAGILLSRIAGFVRESVFAAYFGNSAAADAFRAAIRIPNLLQNLLGEGVLSASFIPVYSSLLGQGRADRAKAVAWRVGGALAAICSLVVLLGILFADLLVELIAPGFGADTKQLTARLVRIFFPGVAFLVLSAWCLGVLNSHRKFFLSYSAPVLWNLVIIVFILIFAGVGAQTEHIVYAAWGMVFGSLLQFVVQVFPVLRLFARQRNSETELSVPPVVHVSSKISERKEDFRRIAWNFFPVVLGRGVVQISAFVDSIIASFLVVGSVAALGYAQILYLLPISLFGMSISAAELPEMSRLSSDCRDLVQERLSRAVHRVLFFVIPTAGLFMILGEYAVRVLFERGAFHAETTMIVASVLAAFAIGLPATTISRVYSSALYALGETRYPVKVSIVRVVISSIVGALLAFKSVEWFNIPPSHALTGLALGAAVGAWIEIYLLGRGLSSRIGPTKVLTSDVWRILIATTAAVIVTAFLRNLFSDRLDINFLIAELLQSFEIAGAGGLLVAIAPTLVASIQLATYGTIFLITYAAGYRVGRKFSNRS